MEIKAVYTVDKTYSKDYFQILNRERLRLIDLLLLEILAVAVLWSILLKNPLIGGTFAVVVAFMLLFYNLLLANIRWKKNQQNKTDGETELCISEKGLLLRKLKYGTETSYSHEQIKCLRWKNGRAFIQLDNKILMLRPEDFDDGGFQNFRAWAAELERRGNIYAFGGLAYFTHVPDKRAARMNVFDSVLMIISMPLAAAFLAALVLLPQEGIPASYEGLLLAVLLLPFAVVVPLRCALRMRSLNKDTRRLHDYCFWRYHPRRAGKNRLLLTMALCRLAAGEEREAEQALELVCSEKLRGKRREIYARACGRPSAEEAKALLRAGRRIDRKRESVLPLILLAAFAALCVLSLNTPGRRSSRAFDRLSGCELEYRSELHFRQGGSESCLTLGADGTLDWADGQALLTIKTGAVEENSAGSEKLSANYTYSVQGSEETPEIKGILKENSLISYKAYENDNFRKLAKSQLAMLDEEDRQEDQLVRGRLCRVYQKNYPALGIEPVLAWEYAYQKYMCGGTGLKLARLYGILSDSVLFEAGSDSWMELTILVDDESGELVQLYADISDYLVKACELGGVDTAGLDCSGSFIEISYLDYGEKEIDFS